MFNTEQKTQQSQIFTPQMMVWGEHKTQSHGLLPLRWWYEMYCTHIWYLNTRLKLRDYYSSDDRVYCTHVWYLSTRLKLRDYYSPDDGMYCTHIWYLNIEHNTNRQRVLEAGAVVDWSSVVYRVLCLRVHQLLQTDLVVLETALVKETCSIVVVSLWSGSERRFWISWSLLTLCKFCWRLNWCRIVTEWD